MKKIVFLLSLATVIACSPDKATTGNPGNIPGNSDKKNYGTHEGHEVEHHEEVAEEATGAFHYDATKTTLTFTAYKLPGEKKAGVKGTFKTINVTGAKESEKAEEVLSDASFSIPVASLSTNDVERDGKLKEFFFGKLINTSEITGNFGKFEGGKVPVTLKLNDKTVSREFEYQVSGRKLILAGEIDIVKDFSASEALNAINEACKELHEGKTWSDVKLDAEIEL